MPSVSLPSFGGRGASLANYEQQVKLRRHVTDCVPAERGSAKIFRTDAVARHVCTSAGGGEIRDQGEADKISAI